MMRRNGITMYFTYDATGRPQTMTYGSTTLYYLTNLQGDVIGLVNSSGQRVVSYTYDAWGNLLSATGNAVQAEYNPLRYRGYVYDVETGLYYLQSRYYDPEIGRFLNADAFASTGQALLGHNMFAYCGNNAPGRKDYYGTFWLTVLTAAAGAVINVATTYVAAKVTGQEYSWTDAGVAALSGAANAIPHVGPIVSGAISGIYTGITAYENGANFGEAAFAGTVSAICTTSTIGNLANYQGPALDIATNAAADLVFGTGNNSISAAVYKSVMTDRAAISNDISIIKPNNSASSPRIYDNIRPGSTISMVTIS